VRHALRSAINGEAIHTFSDDAASELEPRAPVKLFVLGTFTFTISGPPATYAVEVSEDLSRWEEYGVVTNTTGSIAFTDSYTQGTWRFYRVRANE
jgi:hypothetical protein